MSGSVQISTRQLAGKLIEWHKRVVVRTDEVEERDGVLIRTRRKKCQRGALTKMIIVVEASLGYGGRDGSIEKGVESRIAVKFLCSWVDRFVGRRDRMATRQPGARGTIPVLRSVKVEKKTYSCTAIKRKRPRTLDADKKKKCRTRNQASGRNERWSDGEPRSVGRWMGKEGGEV